MRRQAMWPDGTRYLMQYSVDTDFLSFYFHFCMILNVCVVFFTVYVLLYVTVLLPVGVIKDNNSSRRSEMTETS